MYLDRNLSYYVISECLKYYKHESEEIENVVDKISSFLVGIFYDIKSVEKSSPLREARLAAIEFLWVLVSSMNFYDPHNIIDQCIL